MLRAYEIVAVDVGGSPWLPGLGQKEVPVGSVEVVTNLVVKLAALSWKWVHATYVMAVQLTIIRYKFRLRPEVRVSWITSTPTPTAATSVHSDRLRLQLCSHS